MDREGDDVAKIHDKHWAQFETPFWREEIKQGRFKRPRVDLFLYHYLTLQTKGEVLIGQLFGRFRTFVERSGIPAADHGPAPALSGAPW